MGEACESVGQSACMVTMHGIVCILVCCGAGDSYVDVFSGII